jgi:acetolactate synthase-1/2/3 large subunit
LEFIFSGAFGNVKRIQQERYGNRLIASDLHKAFALNAPALVWVPHGDVPSPWDMIMMPRVR